MALPTVSIITVNFNDGIGLERTIQSVIGQSYQDWELIIQDGGSNDNSLPIIHQYASHIAQWDSGQDEGIYDAMNKGIKKAKGTWLIFMNAGDEIASPEVLEKVMQQAQKDADFLYGHTEIHYPDSGFTRLQTASPLATFWKRLPFVHQSMLVKSALMREKMYDLSFSLCADFAFAYPCYKAGSKFQLIDLTIARFYAGGKSDLKRVATTKEVWRVVRRYQTSIGQKTYFFIRMIKALIATASRKVLPGQFIHILTRIKYFFKPLLWQK